MAAWASELRTKFSKPAFQHTLVEVLALIQIAVVVAVGFFCYKSGKNEVIFATKFEVGSRSTLRHLCRSLTFSKFSKLLARRDWADVTEADEGTDFLSRVGSKGGEALSSAQVKASSVVQEASAAVAEVTNAIPKPTLVANMTAEQACMELLSFSECLPAGIDSMFLAGFWILVCGATLTTATFFTSRWLRVGCWEWQIVSCIALILGLFATELFLALTLCSWTIHRLADSASVSEEKSGEGPSPYHIFTWTAFISVVSWFFIRQHKADQRCVECHKAPGGLLQPFEEPMDTKKPSLPPARTHQERISERRPDNIPIEALQLPQPSARHPLARFREHLDDSPLRNTKTS
jgi:hypothetical protein